MEGFLSSPSLVPALFLSLLRRDSALNFLRQIQVFYFFVFLAFFCPPPFPSTEHIYFEHSYLPLETIIKLLWPPHKHLLI